MHGNTETLRTVHLLVCVRMPSVDLTGTDCEDTERNALVLGFCLSIHVFLSLLSMNSEITWIKQLYLN